MKFRRIGEKLFIRGMNNSHSGNISVREDDTIFITATGSMLDSLEAKDIIAVDVHQHTAQDKKASMELLVHRALYQAHPDIRAIVHAHVPHAIVMAAHQDKILPYDQEGQYFLKHIPVLHAENAIASEEVAEKIGSYTDASQAVIVRKHGVFAWGKTLEEAYHFLTVTESICRINYLLENHHAAQNH